MKLNLTYINRTPRTSASGKPYTSISIKAQEYGDQFLSGFGNKANENWKPGDTVEVAEVKEVIKGDKKYLNFEMPKQQGANNELLERILANQERILSNQTKQNLALAELVMWKRRQTGEDKPKVGNTDLDYPELGDGLDTNETEL